MNTTAAPVTTTSAQVSNSTVFATHDHSHADNADLGGASLGVGAVTLIISIICAYTIYKQRQYRNQLVWQIKNLIGENEELKRKNRELELQMQIQYTTQGRPVVAGVPVGVPGSDVVPYADKPAIGPELRFVSNNYENNNKIIQETIADIKLQLKKLPQTKDYWECDYDAFKNFVYRNVQRKNQYYDQAINNIFTKIAGITDTSGQSILTSKAYYDWLLKS